MKISHEFDKANKEQEDKLGGLLRNISIITEELADEYCLTEDEMREKIYKAIAIWIGDYEKNYSLEDKIEDVLMTEMLPEIT
ncbi:MAG: hypothetical protein K9K32_04560 [Halanaerobiales bacterium]|nr:hypothetical protein [Halanaerobiales bacterium]